MNITAIHLYAIEKGIWFDADGINFPTWGGLYSGLGSNATKIAEFDVVGANNSTPYIVKDVSGLDISDINPKYYNALGTDKFTLSVPKDRLVGLLLQLNPNHGAGESLSFLREKLYKTINSSKFGMVALYFMNDVNVVATLDGYVEKFDYSIFSKDTTATMTIRCPYPFLVDPTPIDITDNVLFGPPILEYTDLISTAPSGCFLKVKFTSNVTKPVRLNMLDANETMYLPFEINKDFLADDEIIISSLYKQRSVYMVRELVESSLVTFVTPGSFWPMIYPGVNKFSISVNNSETAISTYDVLVFSHKPTFWGL